MCRQQQLHSSARTRAGIAASAKTSVNEDLHAALTTLAAPAGPLSGRMIAQTGAKTAAVAFNTLLANGI